MISICPGPSGVSLAAYIACDAGLTITTSPATNNPAWNDPNGRCHHLRANALYLMTYQFNRLRTGPP